MAAAGAGAARASLLNMLALNSSQSPVYLCGSVVTAASRPELSCTPSTVEVPLEPQTVTAMQPSCLSKFNLKIIVSMPLKETSAPRSLSITTSHLQPSAGAPSSIPADRPKSFLRSLANSSSWRSGHAVLSGPREAIKVSRTPRLHLFLFPPLVLALPSLSQPCPANASSVTSTTPTARLRGSVIVASTTVRCRLRGWGRPSRGAEAPSGERDWTPNVA